MKTNNCITMKTIILSLTMLSLLSITNVFAQDRAVVTANNSEISDNLDLRAVASIFGDSADLNDFERRLNDPKAHISNLDLNGDNKVDYMRVIETVDGGTHLIVIQSVIGRDTFQDIATVEIERDRNNRVQVQVVGDAYLYGNNYIYEPVYVNTPVIYTSFWNTNYHPYYSSWNWGFYPSFYFAWSPCPVFRYRNNINIYINNYNTYNYVNYRRCEVAYNNYYDGRRGNAFEREYPNRSFELRNSGYANRFELDNNRARKELASNTTRNNSIEGNRTRIGSSRNYGQTGNSSIGNNTRIETPRTYNQNSNGSRGNNTRAEAPIIYGQSGNGSIQNNTRSETPRPYNQNGYGLRGNNTKIETPRNYEQNRNLNQRNEMPRNVEPHRSSSPREFSQQRGTPIMNNANSRGTRRS